MSSELPRDLQNVLEEVAAITQNGLHHRENGCDLEHYSTPKRDERGWLLQTRRAAGALSRGRITESQLRDVAALTMASDAPSAFD